MIEVKKKGDERIDVMVRRFNREVQQSGILTVAKEKRFFEKSLNRGLRRKVAIRRSAINKLKRGW